ncbi:MAG: flagellin [Terracidiphilus sp.]|jgi:flagellin
MLTILNSVTSLNAENALSSTQANLQKVMTQLSTGLRVNSGADDAAGLSIANGLQANIAALTQSSQNASDGVGLLQTADGALSQVTTLLNRAVTLATEASDGGLSTAQATALDNEYKAIQTEIATIGSTTNYNGTAVFGSTASIYTSDGTSSGSNTASVSVSGLSVSALGLTSDASGGVLTTTAGAQKELALITAAISTVAADRGSIGAAVNQLNASANVESTEVTNLQSAVNNIQNADIGQTVAQMTQYNVLEQTGMAALSQSNSIQQNVLKLLQ